MPHAVVCVNTMQGKGRWRANQKREQRDQFSRPNHEVAYPSGPVLKRLGKLRWRLRFGNCNPELKGFGKAIAANGITEGSYRVTIFRITRLWTWLLGHYPMVNARPNARF